MPTNIDRSLHVTIQGVTDKLLLTKMKGLERLSCPFEYQLTLVSDNTTLNIPALIGQDVTIHISDSEGVKQTYNGLIYEMSATQEDYDGHRTYHAIVKPWFAFLMHASDCRIFQNKTTVDIIQEVFKQAGFADYDISNIRKTYTPRVYCVQYNESTFNFVSRLLEDEGIFYTFVQSDQKHVMTLFDSGRSSLKYSEALSYTAETHIDPRVHTWRHKYLLKANQTAGVAEDFTQPSTPFTSSSNNPSAPTLNNSKNLEQFEHPSSLNAVSQSNLDAETRQLMECIEVNQSPAYGESSYLGLGVGMTFSLSGHPRSEENANYLITAFEFTATDNTQRGVGGSEAGHTYENTFACVSTEQPYIPKRLIHKPYMPSLQSATVVGETEGEVYTDEYGRIKIQFPWDRQGQKNANSSCWIRVGQLWAGQKYGVQFIPRVGQEVMVSFAYGNIDLPVVIASVPNADNLPPFTPESTPYQSGIKSHTMGSTNPDDANVLRFDDEKNEVFLHAQKDLVYSVKGNSNITIGGTSTTVVENGNYTVIVDGALTIEATEEISFGSGDSELKVTATGVAIQGDQINIVKGVASDVQPAIAIPAHVAPLINIGNGNTSSTKTYWIQGHLQNAPAGTTWEIIHQDGTTQSGTLDTEGKTAKVVELKPGAAKITFYAPRTTDNSSN